MKTLITSTQVLTLAFADGEYIAPETISDADIITATERYIIPVVGRLLYDRLVEGGYADFTIQHLATPIALYTRIIAQPGLDIRTGQCGAVVPRSSSFQPAGEAAIRNLQRTLRTKARTLLRRTTEYLNDNTTAFPEYDPQENVMNRCAIQGGIVGAR